MALISGAILARMRLNFLSVPKSQIKLQSLLVVALLLVLLPVVLIQAWFSYHTAHDAAVKFEKQLASEVSAHVFDNVFQFFAVPRRVVRFNAEQFRLGVLTTANPQAMQRHFLLQIDQYSILTFLSMGTAQGDYFSASRPPLGEDRSLRVVQATKAEGGVMSAYQVDALNQRTSLIARADAPFDPRNRGWFKAAVGYNTARWYPAYRYVTPDPHGVYDAMGIGMSAPLYDRAGAFVGVMTADVALVQLSKLLAGITKDLGGTAFLFDEGGELLATSTLEQLYTLKDDTTERVKAVESPNAVIRAASKVIRQSTASRGRTVSMVNGESYLLDWRQYPLPDGPTVTIANMLPQSRFDAPSRGLLFNVLFFSAALFFVSLVLIIFVSKWVAGPLVALGQWATRLGNGKWEAAKHSASPIVEVESLSTALQFMAGRVKYHTDHLEQEVAVRTAELTQANTKLEQTALERLAMQGLLENSLHTERQTLANQRQFVAMLSHELRTPMAIIDTAAQRLDMVLKSTQPELVPRIDKIRRAVARQLNLLENCLAEDRLSATELALHLERVDLRDFLVRNYRGDGLQTMQRIHLDLPVDAQWIECDRHLFDVMLSNLVSNALKYSPDDSKVTIRLLANTVDAPHDHISIQVEDRGCGVPPAERERIFDKFRRGEGNQSTSGAGLGLYLARELARRHGGDVVLEPAGAMGGATFTLSLPRLAKD